MTEREITTLREILGRIARRAEHKPDLALIRKLAFEADEVVKNCSTPDVISSFSTDMLQGELENRGFVVIKDGEHFE